MYQEFGSMEDKNLGANTVLDDNINSPTPGTINSIN